MGPGHSAPLRSPLGQVFADERFDSVPALMSNSRKTERVPHRQAFGSSISVWRRGFTPFCASMQLLVEVID